MPKVITDDDLRKMAQRGKLPKGISLWKDKKATEGNDSSPDATMKALADAAMKAVEETGKALNVNAAMIQVVISKLAEMQKSPITVSVPEAKQQRDWIEAEIEVTERDANHNIKKIRFLKKVVK